MWLRALARRLLGRPLSAPAKRRWPSRRVRLGLEWLEDRVTPSTATTLNVTDVSGGTDQAASVTVSTLDPSKGITLRDAINAANNTSATMPDSSYVINLPAEPSPITFSAADNYWYGPNALPAISSDITIEGNGDTLQISGTGMRFFYVSGGPTWTGGALPLGTLELDDLTLTGGVAQGGSGTEYGGGGLGAGGAIFNQGQLTLNGDTLMNNEAIGGTGSSNLINPSGDGVGGGSGIGGGGGSDFQSDPGGGGNALVGGFGGNGGFGGGGGGGGAGGGVSDFGGGISIGSQGGGGAGLGGAIFNMFGTATLLNSTLSGNTAQGGNGGGNDAIGGSGLGGALFNLDGTASLTYVTIANNSAANGTSGSNLAGNADGGGVYNLAFGNTLAGQANTATLTLINSVIGQDQNNGGSDLVNDAQNGKNTNTALVNGSSSVVQGGAQLIGSGTKTVVPGAITNTSSPSLATSLADNGGLTQTLAPNSGSPVLGAGNGSLSGLPTVDQRGLPRPASNPDDGAFQTQTTTTTASNATTTYSSAAQTITLTAHVDTFGDANEPATEGKIRFTVVNSTGQTIGAAASGTVSSKGDASAGYGLPAYTNVGSYTIKASYSDSKGIFAASTNASQSPTPTLSVTAAATAITANNATATYSTSAQNVKLTANVTSSGNKVDEGKVKLSVVNGSSKTIGAATGSLTANSNGNASVTLGLPAFTNVGSYTIKASYSDSNGNFGPSSNASQSPTPALTVTAASTTITASNATATFSTSAQNVTLMANVTSGAGPVDEGKVKLSVVNGSSKTIGAATGSLTANSNGKASVTLGLPAFTNVGSYTIKASYSDSNGNFAASSNAGQKPTPILSVTAASSTTTAVSTTAPFSSSSQYVTLTANVSSGAGPVNEGNVTFTVMRGSTVFGTATTSTTVSNGQASVSYLLPANLAPNTYVIDASYSDNGSNFQPSSNASQTPTALLTVLAVPTTTTAASVATTFSNRSQSVTLTAQVRSNSAAVNGGTVTFALLQGNSVIGTATTSGTVRNGQASVSYVLPANLPAGRYTISAIYNPGFPFAASSDVNQRPLPLLTIAPAATTITANNATVHFSRSTQTVTLTAQVTSTAGVVNEGTVTFTILKRDTVIGTATTSATVHNGVATVSYVLPANLPVGNYTIEAVYNPGGDFRGSADLRHMLYVSPAA